MKGGNLISFALIVIISLAIITIFYAPYRTEKVDKLDRDIVGVLYLERCCKHERGTKFRTVQKSR